MDWVATMGMTRHCRVRANAFSSPLGSSSPTLAKAELVADKDGRPDVAAWIGLHRRRPAEQRLEPRIFQHDADGAGQRRVGAGGHVEGEYLPALDELVKGRKVARLRRRREGGEVGIERVAGVVAGGRRARRGRTEHARHARQVEHAEEHGGRLPRCSTGSCCRGCSSRGHTSD